MARVSLTPRVPSSSAASSGTPGVRTGGSSTRWPRWATTRVRCSPTCGSSCVARWKGLDPDLKALAVMASSAVVGCSWCMDFGYWENVRRGMDARKIRDVPVWRDSDVYTPLERDVLEYAEAMTATPPDVTDELSGRLRTALGERGFVELTLMVAVENLRSRTNSALGLTSQGFKDQCEAAPAGDVAVILRGRLR